MATIVSRIDETASPLPTYEKPPVIEVVCGLMFKPLPDFGIPHLGLWWQQLQPDYPFFEQQGPLSPAIEPEKLFTVKKPQFQINAVPPMPRVWFMNENQSLIIQVQEDRFLTNWKKVEEQQQYPRYDEVLAHFLSQFDKFASFIQTSALGTIEPVQYELTYVNQIPVGLGWAGNGEIGRVLPDFNWRTAADRFLPAPETVNWATTFLLPNKNGRLYVNAVSAERTDTGEQVLQLTLTARGISENATLDGMRIWFDNAREWIVRGFKDITGEKIQKANWGLQE